jgi:hypothetical protein
MLEKFQKKSITTAATVKKGNVKRKYRFELVGGAEINE